MVINVGYFSENEEIRNELDKYTLIRNRTLDICYSIDGYEKLPLQEKNKIYDRISEKISREYQ